MTSAVRSDAWKEDCEHARIDASPSTNTPARNIVCLFYDYTHYTDTYIRGGPNNSAKGFGLPSQRRATRR